MMDDKVCLYRNSKTFRNHIATPGYVQAWCGAYVGIMNRLDGVWTYRGDVSLEWVDKATANPHNRMCKRCTSAWRNK